MLNQSEKVVECWDRPLLHPDYWNLANAMAMSKGRHVEAGGQPVNAYEVALDGIAGGGYATKRLELKFYERISEYRGVNRVYVVLAGHSSTQRNTVPFIVVSERHLQI